jgi:hypothetical protein
MTRATLVGLLTTLVATCGGSRTTPPLQFDSRTPLAPLEEKLRDTGGSPDRIVHPRALADLAPLESGVRYKFVVRTDDTLAIAPEPASTPGGAYAHPVLAGGAAVLTAGGITITRNGASIAKVVVDQDSQAYCPSADSLRAAVAALVTLGVESEVVRIDNRPSACVPMSGPSSPMMAGTTPGLRYGPLMVEVARRFELAGRAFEARRFDLAAFEVDELGEIFHDDLPHAEPPPESAGVNLAGVVDAFARTNLPDLETAVASHESRTFDAAFRRAAETCNGCHKTSGHPFIEVPDTPGQSIPVMTPRR